MSALRNVSDTAYWVAYYRAKETERSDALFRDPLAQRLIAGRGEELDRQLRGDKAAWALVVRTQVLDEILIAAMVREGVDMVINLAAGLDTRPYRLPLTKRMKWIEVDLPAMVEAKSLALQNETPRCELERIGLDLRDEAKRQELFERLGKEAKKALVVSEGLLMYLRPEDVRGLAIDLAAIPTFRYWAFDFYSPAAVKTVNRVRRKAFAVTQSPWQFGTDDAAAFFAVFGWQPRQLRWILEESRRLKREMPHANWLRFLAAFVTKKTRESWRRYCGIGWFENAGS